MQYSLNEITLLPSYRPTDISSRSQVNPFTQDGNLPVFVANSSLRNLILMRTR